MFPEAIQFRDIHATLGNPWWPPAPGWWLLLLAFGLLALALWRFDLVWRLRVPIPMVTLGNWRWDAGRELRRLRRDLESRSLKDSASELSELLRRIAMARHGRSACAGLNGADWLGWLTKQDPKGFDWQDRGRLLLNAPYAPPRPTEADRAALLELIDATMEWVVASDPKPSNTPKQHRASPDPAHPDQAPPDQAPGNYAIRAAAWLKTRLPRLPWLGRSIPASESSKASRKTQAGSSAQGAKNPVGTADTRASVRADG